MTFDEISNFSYQYLMSFFLSVIYGAVAVNIFIIPLSSIVLSQCDSKSCSHLHIHIFPRRYFTFSLLLHQIFHIHLTVTPDISHSPYCYTRYFTFSFLTFSGYLHPPYFYTRYFTFSLLLHQIFHILLTPDICYTRYFTFSLLLHQIFH